MSENNIKVPLFVWNKFRFRESVLSNNAYAENVKKKTTTDKIQNMYYFGKNSNF